MILQLDPMIPIQRISDEMEGYAFLVIDYSQEHNLLFTCAMDDGEIWTLNNKEIKFCKNISSRYIFYFCSSSSEFPLPNPIGSSQYNHPTKNKRRIICNG